VLLSSIILKDQALNDGVEFPARRAIMSQVVTAASLCVGDHNGYVYLNIILNGAMKLRQDQYEPGDERSFTSS